MGAVRDILYSRMGGKFSTPFLALLIKRLYMAGGSSGGNLTVSGNAPLTLSDAGANAIKRLTQTGLCAQASTPTPDAPVDIVCNNGVLRYGALGANLLNPSAENTALGHYINRTDGEIKDSPYNFMFAGYMPVEAGKTYVAYGRAKNGNDLSDYNRVAWYDSTKTWIDGANYTQNQIAVVTAPNNAAYARFSCNPSGGTSVAVTQAIVDSYNWMFAEGTAEITPFIPFVGGIYVDGTPEVLTVSASGETDQTASVVDLLSVGDYADTQEIISGKVNRWCGVLVLDGTENWEADSTNLVYNLDVPALKYCDPRVAGFSTHFVGTTYGNQIMPDNSIAYGMDMDSSTNGTVLIKRTACADAAAFKAFLSAQYAAGTPVILVYPLATHTTETVTGQPLNTAEGTNTVSVTAEVSPVALEAVYCGQEE